MVRALKGGKNPELARGIRARGTHVRAGRIAMYLKKHPELLKKVAKKAAAPKTKQFQGGVRVVKKNAGKPRFYPTEKKSRPLPRRFLVRTPTLRKSITPGTVLILLTGKYRGKRVVFLKQLESGLLLVNGPFVLNGVPLRRISQAYVIATSTKVDISAVKVDAKVNDAFFKAPPAKKAPKDEKTFLRKRKLTHRVSDDRKVIQKAVDDAIMASVKKVELLGAYLKSKFTLTKGQYPHQLRF